MRRINPRFYFPSPFLDLQFKEKKKYILVWCAGRSEVAGPRRLQVGTHSHTHTFRFTQYSLHHIPLAISLSLLSDMGRDLWISRAAAMIGQVVCGSATVCGLFFITRRCVRLYLENSVTLVISEVVRISSTIDSEWESDVGEGAGHRRRRRHRHHRRQLHRRSVVGGSHHHTSRNGSHTSHPHPRPPSSVVVEGNIVVRTNLMRSYRFSLKLLRAHFQMGAALFASPRNRVVQAAALEDSNAMPLLRPYSGAAVSSSSPSASLLSAVSPRLGGAFERQVSSISFAPERSGVTGFIISSARGGGSDSGRLQLTAASFANTPPNSARSTSLMVANQSRDQRYRYHGRGGSDSLPLVMLPSTFGSPSASPSASASASASSPRAMAARFLTRHLSDMVDRVEVEKVNDFSFTPACVGQETLVEYSTHVDLWEGNPFRCPSHSQPSPQGGGAATTPLFQRALVPLQVSVMRPPSRFALPRTRKLSATIYVIDAVYDVKFFIRLPHRHRLVSWEAEGVGKVSTPIAGKHHLLLWETAALDAEAAQQLEARRRAAAEAARKKAAAAAEKQRRKNLTGAPRAPNASATSQPLSRPSNGNNNNPFPSSTGTFGGSESSISFMSTSSASPARAAAGARRTGGHAAAAATAASGSSYSPAKPTHNHKHGSSSSRSSSSSSSSSRGVVEDDDSSSSGSSSNSSRTYSTTSTSDSEDRGFNTPYLMRVTFSVVYEPLPAHAFVSCPSEEDQSECDEESESEFHQQQVGGSAAGVTSAIGGYGSSQPEPQHPEAVPEAPVTASHAPTSASPAIQVPAAVPLASSHSPLWSLGAQRVLSSFRRGARPSTSPVVPGAVAAQSKLPPVSDTATSFPAFSPLHQQPQPTADLSEEWKDVPESTATTAAAAARGCGEAFTVRLDHREARPSVQCTYRVAGLASELSIRRLQVVSDTANWKPSSSWHAAIQRFLLPGMEQQPLSKQENKSTWVIQPVLCPRRREKDSV